MFKINLTNISALILLFIAAFTIAAVTPPITSQAETAPMSSQQRAKLLSDWQTQVASWQKVSATAATTTTGNMLGAKVAALPKTGFIVEDADPIVLNIFKAVLLTSTVLAIMIFLRSLIWREKPTILKMV